MSWPALLLGQHMLNAEDKIVELPGGLEMISLGYSNPTPWNGPRELGEDDLQDRINAMARPERPERAIFSLHCPPLGTTWTRQHGGTRGHRAVSARGKRPRPWQLVDVSVQASSPQSPWH